MLHAHAAIWKERGLLTPVKYEKKKILALFQAVLELLEVAVIHCKGHQKGNNYVNQRNALTDRTATQESLKRALIPQSVEVVKEMHYMEPELNGPNSEAILKMQMDGGC